MRTSTAESVKIPPVSVLSVTRSDQSAVVELDPPEHRLPFSLAAHEVRGPIATIRALLDAFIMQADPTSGNMTLLYRSQEELARMSELMNCLLGWSSGTPQLSIGSVDLVELVRDIAVSVEGEWGKGRVTVAGPRRLVVLADRVHLRIAISNLVRNALAYSPSGASVSVRVQRKHGASWVTVTDRGRGIPPQERAAMFDPFTRGTVGRRTRKGNGLGLFLVKQVIEAHEGQVTVVSGVASTTFGVGLPHSIAIETSPEPGLPGSDGTTLPLKPLRVIGV